MIRFLVGAHLPFRLVRLLRERGSVSYALPFCPKRPPLYRTGPLYVSRANRKGL